LYFLKRRCHAGLSIRAKDRFGDYGLVGTVLYERTVVELRVDTFALSCRAFGRGIEARMFAELGRLAQSEETEFVTFEYRATGRNELAFSAHCRLHALEGSATGHTSFRFSASTLLSTVLFVALSSPVKPIEAPMRDSSIPAVECLKRRHGMFFLVHAHGAVDQMGQQGHQPLDSVVLEASRNSLQVIALLAKVERKALALENAHLGKLKEPHASP
jgi:hypothetical protein